MRLNLTGAILYPLPYSDSVDRRLMSPAKKKSVPNEKVELYDALIKTDPKLERKGAANPYTSLNGNMFTLLHQSQTLAIRLAEKDRDAFLKKYKTKLFEAYGVVMKEYVTVPDALLKKTSELKN
jgi:hypothetical protein